MDTVKNRPVLSQTEIDALIKAIGDGRLDEWFRTHKELEAEKSRFKDDVIREADVSSFANSRKARSKAVNDNEGMLIMTELYLKLNCCFTKSEKEECVHFINRIMELAYHARHEGILVLEEEMEREESFFLKTGISLIVDGTDPVLVKTILQNLILADKYTGAELLGRLILAEGVLSIQQGENPRIIELKLTSILGEEFVQRLNDEILSEQVNMIKNIQFLEAIKDKKALPESLEFELQILELDNRSIQRVLRGIEEVCLVGALHGCGGELIRKIFDNVSHAVAFRLREDLENIQLEDKELVLKCQAEILDKITDLINMGEIITVNTAENIVVKDGIIMS